MLDNLLEFYKKCKKNSLLLPYFHFFHHSFPLSHISAQPDLSLPDYMGIGEVAEQHLGDDLVLLHIGILPISGVP